VIKAGSEPGIMTPDQVLAKAKDAAVKFERVIREANIRGE
jgi:hypothetical protein